MQEALTPKNNGFFPDDFYPTAMVTVFVSPNNFVANFGSSIRLAEHVALISLGPLF